MKDYKWMPIDTPSLMFSCLSTKKWGRTFRVAVLLKETEIDEALLVRAVGDLQPRFPHFFSKLKKGFFRNYLELTDSLPEIRHEQGRAGEPIVLRNDSRPDFRVVYDGRRIAVEVAHYITDGGSCLQFLLTLTQHYLELAGLIDAEPLDGILYWQDEPDEQETDDSFLRYGRNDCEKAKDEKHDVFRFPAVFEKNFLQLTTFTMPVNQLRTEARALQLTLTEYLTAVQMLAIIRTAGHPIHNAIGVDVPVNLRAFFESRTLRNFVYQVSTLLPVDGRQDWTLEEIADVLRGQIRSQLTTENLQSILKKMASLAENPVVRIVPNVIKLPVLRILQARSHADETTIITNLGNVRLPEKMAAHIERFELVNGDTSGYGLPATSGCISFNDILVFCIASNNADDVVWTEMAKILRAEGITVQIEQTEKPQNLLIPETDGKTKAEGSLLAKCKAYFHF